MTQITLYLLGAVMQYCFLIGADCNITSTTGFAFERRTYTHRSGRAFDISIKHFKNLNQAKEMCDHFNIKYSTIAAISKESYRPKACVFHYGTWWHLHFQTRPMNIIPKDVIKELFIGIF